MQVGVDRDDPIQGLRQQPADRFLADRLARMKRSVLTHVAKIGRHQHEPLGAVPPQGFGGEQQRQQLFVGLIERHVKNVSVAAGGPTVTRNSPSGKPMHGDFVHGHPEQSMPAAAAS